MCEELLTLDPRVIIIAMTGHSVESLIAAVLRRGSYACLRKPFDVRDLIHTIAQARAGAGANASKQ